MYRRTLAVVGVALLLATAGCVGSLTPAADANAQVQSDSDDETIRVSATGQAKATPDQAIVRVAVLARADDAEAVRQQLAANASKMRAALAELGISDDQIRTVAYDINQQRREDAREVVGFRGVHAFEITVSNASQAGQIIDAAVSNGADRVETVQLTLSEERRREIRAEALRDAMENARGNAEVIAEAANLTVVGVHTAATGDLSFDSVRTEAARAKVGGQDATEIESGPVTVTAQVQVTYNATEA